MGHGHGYSDGNLFNWRQTTKVRGPSEQWVRMVEAWNNAGEGWQRTEVLLKRMGWIRTRRCVFLRRPAERTPARPALHGSTEFDFVQVLG